MAVLNISINNKVATFHKRGGGVVCRNTDYVIAFTFDSEWEGYENKTARFIWGGRYQDVPIEGTTCVMPEVYRTESVKVGVYAGDLSTTTPAVIPCQASVLCEADEPHDEEARPNINEAKEAAEKATQAAEAAAEAAAAADVAATTAQEAADVATEAAATAAQAAGNPLIGEKSGATVVLDDVAPCRTLSVVSTIDPVQGDGVPSLDNPLHLGTRSSATLTVSNEAESKEFYIDFGQEIYGGTFDWSTGVLTIDRAKHIVDANDRWNEADTASSYAGEDARKRYQLPAYNNKWMSNFIGVAAVIVDSKLSCSTLPTVSSIDTWNNKEGISTIDNIIYFYLEQYATDFEGFKQAIIGTEIVYCIKNPVTVQLTTRQIEALGEITTLSSDMGDTTVKYNRDINKAFAEIMQAIISLGGNV